jgi:ATP phosphoribosyltransferase
MPPVATSGIESPTVAPLSKKGWVAIKSMARKEEVHPIMEKLATMGAKGIIVTDIRTCRI